MRALIHLVLTTLVAWGVTRVTNSLALRPWRRAREAHWTERARLLYPVRVAAVAGLFIIPANLVLVQLHIDAEDRPHWLVLALVAWLGAVMGTRRFDGELFPQMTSRHWLHQAGAGIVLQFVVWFVLLAGITLMPLELGWESAAVAGVYVLFQALLNLRYISVLKWLRLIESAPPELVARVHLVAGRLRRQLPRVWLMPAIQANAFAIPGGNDLVFTSALVDLADEHELDAVCAHEIGHLTESKSVVLLRFVGSLAYLPALFLKPLIALLGVPGLLVATLGFLAVSHLNKILSRWLERHADSVATRLAAEGPAYARVLEKLHQANQIPAVFPKRQQTHPDLYDRMLAAGVEPAYPRPAPPESMSAHGHLLSGLTSCIGINIVI